MPNEKPLGEMFPTQTPETRREQADREIGTLQLDFVQTLMQKEPQERRFVDVLDAQTTQIKEVIEPSPKDKQISPEFQEAVANLKNDIDRIHETLSSDWEMQILERIKRFKDEWGEKRPTETKQLAGIFAYRQMRSEHGIERYGIDDMDRVLEIHLNDADDVTAAKIKRSMEQLARLIVERYPDTRAVVGRSWLMDHPLAKRLGFSVIDDPNTSTRGYNFWLQFIDRTGHVNPERAKELFETGNIRHQSKTGFIPVEQFLERYLPAELRKDPITLKILDPEWKEEERDYRQETKRLGDAWPHMTVEDIEQIFRSNGAFKRRLDELGMTELTHEQFRLEKQAGHTSEQMEQNGEIQRIGKALRDRVEERKRYETVTLDLSE